MKKIIIAAHGNSREGLGDPSVKTITKAEQPLSFGEAKAYMDGAFFPEYASASMSEFSPLSDADCLDLFGTAAGNRNCQHRKAAWKSDSRRRNFCLEKSKYVSF